MWQNLPFLESKAGPADGKGTRGCPGGTEEKPDCNASYGMTKKQQYFVGHDQKRENFMGPKEMKKWEYLKENFGVGKWEFDFCDLQFSWKH